MNTCANWCFLCIFVFVFFWFVLCPFLLGRGERTKTKKTQSKTTNKGNKTTRWEQENHLVLLPKKKIQSTQTRNNTNELFKLSKHHKKNKQTQKHEKNYLVTNMTFKNTRIAGKQGFVHSPKAKQETKHKLKNKRMTYQKQNQHKNRKAETYTMKTKTKTKKNGQKWKQLGVDGQKAKKNMESCKGRQKGK